uniref:Uncharacterized protein n=1 Tax=Coccidioides posadasii RMSCC 3488 TaxID=454284 RepID=A0A0J6I2R5_COCPO|nr:hypothetical protein CPAG_01958 [Coccidioides posadasii RMSCC 3488]
MAEWDERPLRPERVEGVSEHAVAAGLEGQTGESKRGRAVCGELNSMECGHPQLGILQDTESLLASSGCMICRVSYYSIESILLMIKANDAGGGDGDGDGDMRKLLSWCDWGGGANGIRSRADPFTIDYVVPLTTPERQHRQHGEGAYPRPWRTSWLYPTSTNSLTIFTTYPTARLLHRASIGETGAAGASSDFHAEQQQPSGATIPSEQAKLIPRATARNNVRPARYGRFLSSCLDAVAAGWASPLLSSPRLARQGQSAEDEAPSAPSVLDQLATPSETSPPKHSL